MTSPYPFVGDRPIVVPTAKPDSAHLNERQLLQQMLDRLSGLPEALRQTITDHQWSTIPLMIEESNYVPAVTSNPGDPGVSVTAQTSGLELITSVVVSIPAGATALLQLGTLTIPIGVGGVTTMAPLQKLLDTAAVRRVTLLTGAGPVSLFLTGQQMPTYGVLAR